MYDDKWWSELRQSGVLISPTVLQERLPSGPPEIDEYRYNRLRDAYTRYLSIRSKAGEDDRGNLNAWLNEVLEVFLGIPKEWWLRGNELPPSLHVKGIGKEMLRPSRALILGADISKPLLLLKIDERERIGSGKGRNEYSKLVELMRGAKVDLGIITNGEQFRLVLAGMEHDCWVEWEASRWFEDSLGRRQLDGFSALCGKGMFAGPGGAYPLREWVRESRGKQGELSAVLGEQTRKAVEDLLDALDRSIRAEPSLRSYFDDLGLSDERRLEAMYQGAIRMVMRLVVVFYAESRGLLDRDREAYFSSYGAEGLFRQLNASARLAGERSLEDHEHSWPRLLSLFRLIHEGCSDPDLQITRYGGELFERGDARSQDPILRAVALFEDDRVRISDATVFRVLRLLRIGKLRARSGRSVQTVSGPVDFSDLRTEYIGMMYEGLLDYRLREVTAEEEAVVFLNLGDQPALPLSLLRKLSDAQLRDLLKGLGKPPKGNDDEEEAEEGEEETGELTGEEIMEEADREEDMREAEDPVLIWARHAVTVLGKVKKGTGRNFNEFEYRRKLDEEANKLIADSKKEGQMYLVRSSGSRKGTGTFYTRPQLAVPTVKRTLEPLLYETREGEKIPRTPGEILALKVCDPAMGSGSFLVAALNEITEALYRSLWEHQKLKHGDGEATIVLPTGERSRGEFREELVKYHVDEEHFEEATKARLKRYVVERCIYGVDINPLAVELAKLSLWVETLDRELPFGFLDHKLKCGNSLVGCWLDRFQEYPLLAWLREGGDKGHSGINFKKDEWTKAIKDVLNERVRPELTALINGQMSLSDYAFEDGRQVESLKGKALRLAEEMHSKGLFGDGFQEREEFYREKVLNDEGLRSLRQAFDLWCSIWFWPADSLDECPTPSSFYRPSEALLARSSEIARELQFFHWELEFPDVFFGTGGFDSIIGNPPWEISKPISKEFFTLYDPIYRTYGKQEALTRQRELFSKDRSIERAWLSYNARFKAMSNWVGNVAYPYGDSRDEVRGGSKVSLGRGKGDPHDRWRERRERKGVDASGHPFRHQGSADLNTYKLFLEMGWQLNREGGRLGLIVPSGIYTDNGTKALRELFIEHNQWEWIFCFENRKKIFNIDSRFKFGPVIVQKGGRTERIRTAFMRHDLEDWEEPERFVIDYGREQIDKFSPKSKSILEIQSQRDLEILTKIYSNSVLLGDQGPDGWGIKYATEFDMTNDSHLFPPRSWWEEKGYKPDQYGRWLPPEGEKPKLIYKGKEIGPPGDIGLPLYQGIMIWQYDSNYQAYVSGAGNRTKWEILGNDDKDLIYPQFILPQSVAVNKGIVPTRVGISFRDITNATNERTMVASLNLGMPCGNVLGVLTIQKKENSLGELILLSILNSFCYDFAIRNRIGGTHLNYYIIEETPLAIKSMLSEKLVLLCAQLTLTQQRFSPLWLTINHSYPNLIQSPISKLKALTEYERVRVQCLIDSLLAAHYGLSFDDFQWILRMDTSQTKGFWRVDSNKPMEIRRQIISLYAYKCLQVTGIDEFCKYVSTWVIPDKIKFFIKENGTIDFDDPNGTEYEVASKLGPRYLPWQLEGTPEESWKECEMHARNILGEEGFRKFMKDLEDGKYDVTPAEESPSHKDEVLKVMDKARSTHQETIDVKRKQKGLFDFSGDGK
ncbi:MAG: Eco57I restriction-modification methylase [Methanomassiliicoccales archaeon PtaB.Bin134]|nr:MAG: Eco57I restriction-modification methylase [Methanomassiliicoccales archaeon PtaB.Bin134]